MFANRASWLNLVYIKCPLAISANWGSILFLMSLSLSSIFLYYSSETSLLVSKVPSGTVNGLDNYKEVPEFFPVRLGPSVFLLNLRGVTYLENALVSVLLGYLYLVDSDVVQKRRHYPPGYWNTWRGIDYPELKESATIVQRYFFEDVLKQCGGYLAQTHPS